MGKNKKKKKDLFSKKAKRLKKPDKKAKRVKKTKKIKSPYKVIVRDWSDPMEEHREIELNENSKLEIHINGVLYSVSINKKNNCLQLGSHERSCYIQPVTVNEFLVRANPKKK